jgi:hypothetical protein
VSGLGNCDDGTYPRGTFGTNRDVREGLLTGLGKLRIQAANECPLRDSNPHRIGFRDRRSAVELRGPRTSMSARGQAAVGRTTITDDSTSQTTRRRLLRTLAMASRTPRLARDTERSGTPIPLVYHPIPIRLGRTAARPFGKKQPAAVAPAAVPAGRNQSFDPTRHGFAADGRDCAAAFDSSVATRRPGVATSAKCD